MNVSKDPLRKPDSLILSRRIERVCHPLRAFKQSFLRQQRRRRIDASCPFQNPDARARSSLIPYLINL